MRFTSFYKRSIWHEPIFDPTKIEISHCLKAVVWELDFTKHFAPEEEIE